ncbi:hypothetical protein [Leptotrichia wadei]|uniref:hypothetical protein n=1 Tax=Leptotrichia wadei TaxID=157687 RepID=UPI0028DD1F9D|nr:hypothetical protein [Leptotrichia wadei]
MKNINDKKLLDIIKNDILIHKNDYEKEEIIKIKEIFNNIINITEENEDYVEEQFMDIVGDDARGVYYYKNIWIIELLIKVLQHSEENKERALVCLDILNNLYYFYFEDLNELKNIEEYQIEKRKIKEKLYSYSDKFYDGLFEKYENINSKKLNEISDSNIEMEKIKEVENKKTELKKPIEQTYDSIRNWLLPLLRKDDKIIFPKEEFLERVKLFDEAEKLRTFNVIKLAVEHDNYCVKFEEDKTIRGYEVIKAFGEMLGIAVEEEVVENVEETEVEEEKKLTSQQLRKKYFLKRMKGENK